MSISERLLKAAHQAADAAAAEILPRFRGVGQVQHKDAASPIVTEADLAAEEAMRAVLTALTPEAGIVGEELDDVRPDADLRWVLDPIDGTIAFACGKPLFTTLIALLQEGRPVLGVIHQAVTGERWVGTARGTTLAGDAVQVRTQVPMEHARIASTEPSMFRHRPGLLERLQGSAHVISWGGDAYNYGALASGQVDVVVEHGLALHDYAALVPVVQGAGGKITDWDGQPLSPASGPRSVLAAGCPELHRQVLAWLRELDPSQHSP
ncbi:MAG: histidinol phosphate phosphatase [Myxococcales bacterium]|nr:histidinol phosphate phosphatase [Myxococcales bacterium]